MNDTTVQLPVFRVAGLSRDSTTDTLAADIEEMRRLWLEGSLKTELAEISLKSALTPSNCARTWQFLTNN